MNIICLDLEGVLVPEIWIDVARRFSVDELKLTTRDIPDYDRLMRYRIGILKKKDIRLEDIQAVICGMNPLPGALEFLSYIRQQAEVIILSDTFYQFAGPLMKKLGHPTLFCNMLKTNPAGFISGYKLRQKDGKTKAVKALRGLGFKVHAAGDSYNDLGMLKAAHQGVLFRPPESIIKKYRRFPVALEYDALRKELLTFEHSSKKKPAKAG